MFSAKKLVCFLLAALTLMSVCSFASADTSHGVATEVKAGAADGGCVAFEGDENGLTAKATTYFKRGATINLWFWHNAKKQYNLNTGRILSGIDLEYYGYLRASVVSGASWLSAYVANNYSSFGWNVDVNYSSKPRVGVIRFYDRKGTLINVRVTQAGRVKMLAANRIGYNTIQLVYTKTTAIHGYVVYYSLDDGYSYKLLKTTTQNTVAHGNRKLNRYYQYYVRPYRVMGGKLVQGPLTHVMRLYIY